MLTRSARFRTAHVLLAVIAIVLSAVSAQAYGLASGCSSITVDPLSSSGIGSWIVDDVNQLGGQAWYYRIADGGISNVNTLGAPVVTQSSASALTLLYTGQYVDISIKYILMGGPVRSGAATVAEQIRVKNKTGAVLPFRLFEYTNLDLNNTPSDDRAISLGSSAFAQWDGSSLSTEAASIGGITPTPSRWEIGDALGLLAKLDSGLPVELYDGVTSLVGDAAVAFQWDMSIPAGGTKLLSESVLLSRGGALGDTVWYDSDGDGAQDQDEAGIQGVSVRLSADFDKDGIEDFADTTTTGETGYYLFANLPAGAYTVTLDQTTLPLGAAPTYDLDGVDTPNTAALELLNGEVNPNVDFGYRRLCSVGDRVWNDLNGNGSQETGEPGISGVTVFIKNIAGDIVATTVTDGDGIYGFADLAPGAYTVLVDISTLPGAMSQTYDLNGPLDHSAAVTVAAGDNRTDVDFGYWRPASLGDRIWLDTDGDGVQDAGEAGINGVTVFLRNSEGNIIGTALTADDGIYRFDNLRAGTYSVSVDAGTLPVNMVQTYDLDGVLDGATTLALGIGDNRTDLDFGYKLRLVVLTPDIELVKTGPATARVGDTITYHFVVTNTGQTALDITVDDAMLGGVIWQKNGVLPGEVNEFDAQYVVKQSDLKLKTSGARTAGIMCVPNPPPPCPPPAYLLVNTATATGVPPAGENVKSTSSCTTEVPSPVGSVGDRIWNDLDADGIQDAGEPGINGVKVTLRNSSGIAVAVDYTSGNGSYLFENLQAGTYRVSVSTYGQLYGYQQTYELDSNLNSSTQVSLEAGQDRTDVDFGYVANRPRICLIKTGPETAVVGAKITYHFKVTNTGNTVLDVVVNDPLLGGIVWTKQRVAPGETNEFERAYVVELDDCNTTNPCGFGLQCVPTPPQCPTPPSYELINCATATGDSPLGGRVTSQSSCKTIISKPSCLQTFTQGGWGSKPQGGNPGALLQNNFGRVYPCGYVVIGGGCRLKFLGSTAVRDFLPQGGTPGTLKWSAVNPTTSAAGVFAGQVLALKLNVDFSNAGITAPGLAQVKVSSGRLAGRSVSQVLAIAEQVLGGNTSALPAGMTISQLNDLVDWLNNRYDN